MSEETDTDVQTDAVALGAFVRDRRIELDLSQSEAARRAGVSRRTWCEIEGGQRPRPSALTLNQLDQVLELTEGTLWSMTQQSSVRQADALRQRAINIIKSWTTEELLVFIESQGTETLRSMISKLMELRGEREPVSPRRRAG